SHSVWRSAPTASATIPKGHRHKKEPPDRRPFFRCYLASLLAGRDRPLDQLFLTGGLGRLLLLLALGQNEFVAMRRVLAQLAHGGTRARRDQPADDHVLLQAVERIDLALHRGFGEHARRLLER